MIKVDINQVYHASENVPIPVKISPAREIDLEIRYKLKTEP